MGEEKERRSIRFGRLDLPVSKIIDDKASTGKRVKAIYRKYFWNNGTVWHGPEIKGSMEIAPQNGHDVVVVPRGSHSELITGRNIAENPTFKSFKDLAGSKKVKGAAAIAIFAAIGGIVLYKHLHDESPVKKK